MSLLSQLAYVGEVWLRTIFLLLIMFIFSSLWHTTYAETGRATLGGFTLTQMLWYLAITESVILSRPREGFRIDEEVRTGSIAYSLARPYNFLAYRFAQVTGERLLRIAVNLAVSVPLALLFTRGVGVRPEGLLPAVAVLLVAITIDYLLIAGIQLLAFWVEDTVPFQFIYDRLLMILGGMLLPLSLFPDRLRIVAETLPFSSIIYGPARTAVDFTAGEFLALLARQGTALLGAALFAWVVFTLGVRRVHANGG